MVTHGLQLVLWTSWPQALQYTSRRRYCVNRVGYFVTYRIPTTSRPAPPAGRRRGRDHTAPAHVSVQLRTRTAQHSAAKRTVAPGRPQHPSEYPCVHPPLCITSPKPIQGRESEALAAWAQAELTETAAAAATALRVRKRPRPQRGDGTGDLCVAASARAREREATRAAWSEQRVRATRRSRRGGSQVAKDDRRHAASREAAAEARDTGRQQQTAGTGSGACAGGGLGGELSFVPCVAQRRLTSLTPPP